MIKISPYMIYMYWGKTPGGGLLKMKKIKKNMSAIHIIKNRVCLFDITNPFGSALPGILNMTQSIV
jgi:hypothetical protein